MKVLGTANPADLMTKHLTREKINNAIDKMGQIMQEGRANSSLDIQGKMNVIKSQGGHQGLVETTQRHPTLWGARAPQGAEDHWARHEDKVVRFHSRPRTRLFTANPRNASTQWQSSENLGPIRTTQGKDQDGNEFILHDYWRAARWPNRQQPVLWTGSTTFHSEGAPGTHGLTQ